MTLPAITNPIRVLHVVGCMNRGGVETWLMNILRNVSHDEVKIDFLVHSNNTGDYDNEITVLGAKRHVCEWPAKPQVYAANFYRILREEGPYDVVHSHVHHFSGFVLMLAKLAGVPIRIAHSHSDTTVVQDSASLVRKMYFSFMEKLIRSHATSGIAVGNNAAMSLFGKDWRTDRHRKVLYCGIDVKPFESAVDCKRVRCELGISETAFVVGHVGRFDRPKNHVFLIDIFEQVIKRRTDAILLLIGDGKLRPNIEIKVENLGLKGSVIFAGLRDDIPHLMRGAMDVFVFPSIYEGLPLAGIEAQAASLPIIASDVITRELFIDGAEVIQLGLDDEIDKWAWTILNIVPKKSNITDSPVRGSRFDISKSIPELYYEYQRFEEDCNV